MVGPETVWSVAKWMPTQANIDKGSVNFEELTSLRKELRQQTLSIFSAPYVPSLWLGRGATFLQLGYPELALGDFYKAKILVEEALRHDSPIGAAPFLMVERSLAAEEHGEVVSEQAANIPPEKTLASKSLPFEPQTRLEIMQVIDREEGSSCLSTDSESFVSDETAPSTALDEDNGSTTIKSIEEKIIDEPGRELVLKAVKQMRHSTLQYLIIGLRAAGAVVQALEMCKNSRAHHPDAVEYKLLEVDIRASMTEQELKSLGRYGDIHQRVYPWITKDLLQRNDKTFDMIQKEFTGVGATIELKPSKFLKSLLSKDAPSDLYGVHAIRNIPINTVVFFDSSLFFATTAPGRCPTCAEHLPPEDSCHKCGGCSTAFCNEACWWRAVVEIHDPICGLDFSYLFSAAEKPAVDPESSPFSALEPLLLLRVIAKMLQPDMTHMLLELQSSLPPNMAHVVEVNSKTWVPSNPNDHPLTQPIVSRLTANYYSDSLVSFSYEDQIVNPTGMLQTLGIDIFANRDFDTWVLDRHWKTPGQGYPPGV